MNTLAPSKAEIRLSALSSLRGEMNAVASIPLITVTLQINVHPETQWSLPSRESVSGELGLVLEARRFGGDSN